MFDRPHRRHKLLTHEWVLVSPQRANRPWQGQLEKTSPEVLPCYDPTCYLCPDNERAGGVKNPPYISSFVFDNDFAAILPEDANHSSAGNQESTMFISESETGICRVVCFSPRHDLTVPELLLDEVEEIINIWSRETDDLQQYPGIVYVQVFENKGAVMGCSNPHPHSQIWSQSQLPNEVVKKVSSQHDYFAVYGRPLLLDYLVEEQQAAERILAINEDFTALVPSGGAPRPCRYFSASHLSLR